MNDAREGLLSRFRANLLNRVKNVGALFEVLEFMPNEPDALRQVRGELHTFKGEARMLGLVVMADIAHALEDALESEALLFDRLHGAANALREALNESDAKSAEAQLAPVLASLMAATPGEVTRRGSSLPPAMIASTPPEDSTPRAVKRWVQVEASTIDELCDQITELADSYGRLRSMLTSSLVARGATEASAFANDVLEHQTLLERCVDRTWNLRLVSVEPMLGELEQHARLLAHRQGKELDITVSAGGVNIERDVVDIVWDSLLHLVRNAIAHGLEQTGYRGGKPARGSLTLQAESAGPHVIISVQDDGRGIHPEELRRVAVQRGFLSETQAEALSNHEAIDLIFRHGFSTSSVADQLSGRGVGLDVVRDRIDAIGGFVEVDSWPGEGTKFTLTLPFAITKERVLVFQLGESLYGIPSRVVLTVIGSEGLGKARGEQMLRHEQQPIALRSLERAVGLGDGSKDTTALVLQVGKRRVAASIRAVVGERELIRRPSGALLSHATGVGASALLDDGELVLLLDLRFVEQALGTDAGVIPDQRAEQSTMKQKHILVVDDSPVVTEMMAEILSTSGLSVTIAGNGVQALAAIDKAVPDLILTDYEMPQMDGLELLRQVRKRFPTLPVVMLTTRGSVEDRQKASSLGANAYVLKSGFRSDVLLDVVDRFLKV